MGARRVKGGRAAAAILSACVLFGAPGAAGAQPSPGAARTATPKERARAVALFDAAKVAYRDGQFAHAIELLQQAYAITSDPVLRYDMGRAYEGLGDLPAAAREYEAFLTDAADVPDRRALEQRIETLRRQLADAERLRREREEAEARARTAAPTPEPSRAPWPWIVAGTGGGVVIVGGVFGLLAETAHHDAENAASQQATLDANDRARSRATTATALFIGGAALVVAGGVWWILARPGGGAAMRAMQAIQTGVVRF